jgi:protein RPN4
MSDIYNDELYSPSFTYTPAPSTKSTEGAPTASRPQPDVFAQRLQAANRHHLSASSRSPLLESPQDSTRRLHGGSPLAPMLNTFGSPSMRINSAKQMREKQKAESDARALQQQMQRSSPQQATPKTISPKDAMLEFHETEQDAMMPLCSPHASQYVVGNNSVQDPSPSDVDETASQRSFASMVTSRRESSSAFPTPSQAAQQQGSLFNFIPPSVPERLRIPQQYPFMPQQRRMQGSASSLGNCAPDFPSSLSLVESGTGYTPEESDLKKPTGSTAEGGTYTCTYHGCTLRFETPAKLQKHKREGHRQSVPVAGGRGESAEGGMTSAALRDSQAGPHYCKRNNPSTGKPCNTAFSRPYDLTRHEDTIHNARKQKVRCQLCTEEKTFSRNDALTRHMRVVHPEVDFSGKARRRGHD